MAKSIISMPPAEELAAVEDGFYATAGFPDTIGTVDGTLVRITRHTTLKAGSVARISLHYVPPGKHLLADAGYKIWGHMLTPFPEADATQDPRKRRYNKAHPRTRIVVECAFGRFQNRFRVLLGKLEQKTSDRICKVIMGCAVLHNMLTLMRDGLPIHGEDPLLQDAPAPVSEDPVEREQAVCHQQGIAKRNDIADILMRCS
ncbi:DDE superfamily endonuclease [Phytophthora infestans]|uniref:DDE superfamily endonuclease n=1 Tax=Phytophthora infestans TaxID=4787 RepID=A0A8S9UK74_PHYIN|nr:DDE superfamily endonuclease [Phytophthora infestans]